MHDGRTCFCPAFAAAQPLSGAFAAAYELLKDCFEAGGKVLIGGNGGSCADAEHIVGELMKGFKLPRRLPDAEQAALRAVDGELGADLCAHLQGGLPAIALSSHPSLNTAYLNDVGGEEMFAQQLHVLGRPGDVFLGISTSGNAKNVRYAAIAARAKGMKVISLTGRAGSRLSALSDAAVRVPETETYRVQELHLPVYHALCAAVEEALFSPAAS